MMTETNKGEASLFILRIRMVPLGDPQQQPPQPNRAATDRLAFIL
jgi:hypothetical protein